MMAIILEQEGQGDFIFTFFKVTISLQLGVILPSLLILGHLAMSGGYFWCRNYVGRFAISV